MARYRFVWKLRPLVFLFFLPTLLIFSTSHTAQAQFSEESASVGQALSQESAATLRALQAEGKRKGYTFKVGPNGATKRKLKDLCGLKEPKNWRTYAPFVSMASLATTLPSEFDWREWGALPPVRDQGQCGSCWAFGVVGPLESQIKMYCGEEVDLSEQYLVSCNDIGYGCANGGWFDAHNYHLNWLGVGQNDAGAVLEADAPYRARDAACGKAYNHPYKLKSWSYISGYPMPSVQAIKQAIYNYGPVAAAVCAGSNFQYYTGGIFNANDYCSGNVNHAIMLVGWKDDLGPDNGYWILRNTWGSYWGENGYMRIRYGKSRVGYGANFVEYTACGEGNGPGPQPEPQKLPCELAVTMNPGDTVTGATTPSGADVKSLANTYKGCSWLEDGTENVYIVTTNAAGDLKAELRNVTEGKDLDVFILKDCDPATTIKYGDVSALYANAPAGTYYIVVDGKKGTEGASYDLSVQSIAPAPDLVGEITRLASLSNGTRLSCRVKVRNIGKRAAMNPTFTVYQVDAEGNVPDANTPIIKTNTYKRIAPGGTVYLNFTYYPPAPIPGKYFLLYVDPGEQIIESDETNNKAYRVVP